jgi:putative tRNA adenosine deaminase-associated protein
VTDEVLSEDDVDFVIAAYREEGRWVVARLPDRVGTTAEGFLAALRQLPGEGGVFGALSVADEFFLLAHTVRDGVRILISDETTLLDWPIARAAAAVIGLDWSEDDLEEFEITGDVDLCAEFGLDAVELAWICADPDRYPDEQVRAIASKLGFGRELASALRS